MTFPIHALACLALAAFVAGCATIPSTQERTGAEESFLEGARMWEERDLDLAALAIASEEMLRQREGRPVHVNVSAEDFTRLIGILPEGAKGKVRRGAAQSHRGDLRDCFEVIESSEANGKREIKVRWTSELGGFGNHTVVFKKAFDAGSSKWIYSRAYLAESGWMDLPRR